MLATGTRGDVQPYIALGVALQAAGKYRVRIAASETFESLVKGFGLEFYPVQEDISKIASDSRVQNAMEADNPLKIILSFSNRDLQPYFVAMQKKFYAACQGSDAIVYHPGAAIGYFIAQALKVPSILASPFPMTPTQDYPALIFYDSIRLGKGFNRLTHLLFEQTMWQMSRSSIKPFWQQEFGSLPPNFSNPFPRQQTPHRPTLVSGSEYVFPKPSDWPANVHNTGYWFLDEGAHWQPPEALQDFLLRGKPPVYVGFGSLGNPTKAAQTTALVAEALQRSGQRGILATGWSGMTQLDTLPDDLFMIESAPHAWLLPKMAAVVHHGGAGTTAAGLRAGVPSVIIPHANDQFAWGRRVYELGVGAQPIPRKKLTVENLSAAIHSALNPTIQQAAKQLGEKIQSENGAETAAHIIAQCLE